jgi:hypothetical protein
MIDFDLLVFKKASIQGENCHLGSHKANAVRRALIRMVRCLAYGFNALFDILVQS